MATVNYSVPEEVKRAFNEAFSGRNRSAIIARLMARAVEEHERKNRRADAIDRLLARRDERPTVQEEQVRAVREETRQWP